MYISLAFLLPLVATSAAFHLGGSCNCGLGSGEDVCSGKDTRCSPLVVRPVDVPRPVLPTPKVVCAPVGGITPLIPIGGPCSCHSSLVKPAVVPRPTCLACASSCGGRIDITDDRQLTTSQKQQILFGGTNGGYSGDSFQVQSAPILIDDEDNRNPINPAHYVTADPVSLHVAYKLAQESDTTCNQGEDKLSFGFRTLPKEIPLYLNRKSYNNIPEENLFSLNGQIVELKKTKCSSTKSVDEEAKDQLLQLAEEEEEERLDSGVSNVKQISLGEIGYGPAKLKQPLFVNIKPLAGAAPDDGLGQQVNCNDGFKPGNVVIRQGTRQEDYERPVQYQEPCGDDDSSLLPPPPALPSGGLFTSPYTYLSSSSSSAASSNLFKKSVFLQKIGCN